MTCRESLLQFSQESFVFQFSNDIKTEIYRTVILTAVLCELGTWCLILSEKFQHGMFENRVLRRILGPKREKVMGEWIMVSYMICAPLQILFW
jgi:hypothetical protein